MQAAAHEEVLGRFDRDMEALAAAEVHPAARAAGLTRLLDLLPEAKLRDWAAECARAHRQFADKVPLLVRTTWRGCLRRLHHRAEEEGASAWQSSWPTFRRWIDSIPGHV